MNARVNGILIVLLTMYMSFSIPDEVHGQAAFDERDIVFGAFSKSNTILIRSYMGSYVNLHVADQTGVYTAQQAVAILLEFFKNHPPNSVAFIKEGKLNLNYFCIAKYLSRDEIWRIYLLFYSMNGKYIIKQIDIEKE